MCLSMIRPEATASALMRCCNYCSILRSSGSTVPSMVTKQMLQTITIDPESWEIVVAVLKDTMRRR